MRTVRVVIGAVVLALALSVAWYYHFSRKHTIFSTYSEGLYFKAYCQHRGLFIFTTFVEVSGSSLISLNEIPFSTDGLTDCKMRFPIEDIRADGDYSCLTISFRATDATPALFGGIRKRPPIVIPLALEGLDLPLAVREKVQKGKKGCDITNPASVNGGHNGGHN